jgi:hypothetical protein
MKKTLALIASLFFGLVLFAQYKITQGKEIELKIETEDFKIVAADNTGLYFMSLRTADNALAINRGFDYILDLYKVDKDGNVIFHKNYRKQLRGRDYDGLEMVGNDLYLFATDQKGRKTLKLYGARIDKNNGELAGDLPELQSFKVKEEVFDFHLHMAALTSGTSFFTVADISIYEQRAFAISIVDQNLKVRQGTTIQPPFAKYDYKLKDIYLTSDNKILLLARTYEEVPAEKKDTDRRFKNYILSVYNFNGQKERDIPLPSGDDIITGAKFIENGGELLLAAFYSNSSRKDAVSGFFINKIDVNESKMIPISRKEINPDMFAKSFVDYSDEFDDNVRSNQLRGMAQQIRAKGSAREYPDETIIRSIIVNPSDSSMTIIGEIASFTFHTYTHKVRPSVQSTWIDYGLHTIKQKDILVINADKHGNIRWQNTISKSQEEEEVDGYLSYPYFKYFDRNGLFYPRPPVTDYSSFVPFVKNNSLIILMNDHTNNATNAKPGDMVKTVINFGKTSSLYAVKIDLSSGKMSRELVVANTPEALMRPKDTFVVNDEVFIPSISNFDKKTTKIKITKISLK